MKDASKTFRITKVRSLRHYQRRVPVSLVPQFGKKFWNVAFGLIRHAGAIRPRAIEDVKVGGHLATGRKPCHRRDRSVGRWRGPGQGPKAAFRAGRSAGSVDIADLFGPEPLHPFQCGVDLVHAIGAD
ncbi:hypothetical protein MASR1M32_37020 [Rhodobacter sp.]